MQMTAHDIQKADNLDHTDNHDEFVYGGKWYTLQCKADRL